MEHNNQSQDDRPSEVRPAADGPFPQTLVDQSVEQSAFTAAKAPKQRFWQRWTTNTRAYLAEYVVLLIVLSSLIFLLNTLFAGIIDNFGSAKHDWYWSGSFAYKTSIAQLAATLALIPVLILLTKRTGGTEDAYPAVKQSNWRKAFLGVFLVILGLTAVGYTIGIIYVISSAILNAGLAVETNSTLWQALLKNAFAILLFGLSALLYARDYRGSDKGNVALWRRVHRYGLVLLALVAVVVFALLPLKEQRNAYVDELVVGDMETISSEITSYSYKHGKLPSDLKALDLEKEVETRLESQKYEYKPSTSSSYELCATFKTDASNVQDEDDSIVPIAKALTGGVSLTDLSSSSDDSFSNHDKGHQCFDKTAAGVRTTMTFPTVSNDQNYLPNSPSSTYDDFDFGDYESLSL